MVARGITPYVTLYHWDLPQVRRPLLPWAEGPGSGGRGRERSSWCGCARRTPAWWHGAPVWRSAPTRPPPAARRPPRPAAPAPQALEDAYGGFQSDKIVADFAAFAGVAFAAFGDRVRNWMTFNEPWVVCELGYGRGDFAPGARAGAAGAWGRRLSG
jgi:hypothetical protein